MSKYIILAFKVGMYFNIIFDIARRSVKIKQNSLDVRKIFEFIYFIPL